MILNSKRSGFTLIEMLMVVVIIGIMAVIAIPKFANSKGKSYAASMKSDLRNLATAEEVYYYDNSVYTTDINSLVFQPTALVSLSIPAASTTGWSAVATHPAVSQTCAVFFGAASPPVPAVIEGVASCQ